MTNLLDMGVQIGEHETDELEKIGFSGDKLASALWH